MKRVLLDHCVPRAVRKALTLQTVVTAFQQGWGELKNGALLDAAEQAGFDVLITADKNLRYQQNLKRRRMAIIELPTNALPALIPHFQTITDAVEQVQPTSYVVLSW